jgi:septal ring factor EnvC (AmiA/AmiB activator)
MRLVAIFALLFLPVAGFAQAESADRARTALVMLEDAAEALAEAQSARDRVRALTATVVAYEEGLSALRTGLRQASLREAELAARLQAHDGEIAALLVALQKVGDRSSPVMLLHPAGPLGTVRAGMLLADVAPALNREADALREDLEELRALQAVQTDAANRLATGLTEVQTARTALNQAMADRTDLPQHFVADPVRQAILIASADTLESFAAGLDELSADDILVPPVASDWQRGSLDLPLRGRVLRHAGTPDAAGVTRPGIIVQSEPRAIVTSPVAATLRYVGPLLDFGEVVILEPQADVLFIFAGLDVAYGNTGGVVEAGAPLGLMGASGDKSEPDFSTDGDEAGTGGSETLYIEVRKNNTPEDPSLWFRTDKDG